MSASDTKANAGNGMAVAILALLLILLVVLPFVPLALAFAEDALFHSHYVEDSLRTLGIHDELGIIYKPVIDFLEWVFG